ncbi:MAG: hypothetical protein ACTSYI_03285, partial [Promethearchaeota archaeon]
MKSNTHKYILFGLLVLFLTTMINSAYGLTDTSANWRIQPGTVIKFGLDTYTNSSTHTIVDEIAEEYDFDNLDHDFFGMSEVKFNITAINTSVSISQLVNNFLSFTAPIQSDQILNDTAESKINYLPLCVPIDMWDEFQSEFEARSFSCTIEYTGTDEVMYTVNWEFEGQNALVTFYWDVNDGSLQAIFYEVGMGPSKDVLILRLSGLQKSNSWDEDMLPYVITAVVVSILVGIGVATLRIRLNKHRRNMGGLEQNKGHLPNIQEDPTPSIYEYDPHFLEGFQRFKRRYLIRSAICNGFSIGVFALGIYFLDGLENTLENENMVIGVILGGMSLLFVITRVLNIPILKFQKQLTPSGPPKPLRESFSRKSRFKSRLLY